MALPTFAPPYPPTSNENTPEVKLLKAEFGDGYTQEGGDGLNNVRDKFRLSWDVLTPAQAAEIENFFVERAGYKRFWYQISDSPAPIKFACEEWSRERGTPNKITATFSRKFDLGD